LWRAEIIMPLTINFTPTPFTSFLGRSFFIKTLFSNIRMILPDGER
jgi:hypothetical protein